MNKRSLSGALILGFAVLGTAVAQQTPQPTRTSEKTYQIRSGKDTYDLWCLPCHGKDPHMAGTIALQAKYKGNRPADLIERTDPTEALIVAAVRKRPGIMSSVPIFRQTEITDAELKLLAQYLVRK
jgi:mono/diheme cytochrome c family protein